MNFSSHSRRLITIFLAVSLVACNFGTLLSPARRTDQAPASHGSGSYDLTDLEGMLNALHSYRAKVSLHFDGTQDGSASVWDITYTLRVSQQPAARLLIMDGMTSVGWMIGEIDGTRYIREGQNEDCQAEIESAPGTLSILDPAAFIPRVWGAAETGTQADVNGVPSKQYRFDESALGMKGKVKASGELWAAADGGYPVKYSLQAEGGEDFFDANMQGKMTWEYELTDINSPVPVEPPEGCPPGRVTAPRLDDASNVLHIPGSLTYETGSDVAAAAAFYQKQMPAAGYEETDTYIDPDFARLQYMNGSQKTTVYIWGGKPTTVQIALGWNLPAEATLVAPEVTDTSSTGVNLSTAFSITADMDRKPKLPSYHLEIHQLRPEWDANAGRMTSVDFTLGADIQGADVHLVRSQTAKGNPAQTLEGYLIGDKEYKVVGGKVQESLGTITIEWVSWSLDVFPAIGTASIGATRQGTDSIEGRPVDVFLLDTAKADPVLVKAWLDMNPLPTAVTSASGTAWVDQQTGALLKLTIDYEAQVLQLSDKTVLGTGSGHLEITVSQIGSVTVQLP